MATADQQLYLGLLAENARKHRCAVHAYVLMPNHVHLLLTEQEAGSVSALIRGVNQRYVQHVNRAYVRTGSLWEGRFHSSIIDTDRYFFACMRYIELNPVRAELTWNPRDYPWSSHGHNAWGQPSLFIEPHPRYSDLGADASARLSNYNRMFDRPLPECDVEAIRKGIKSGLPTGSDEFLQALEARFGRRLQPRPVGRPSITPKKWGPSLVLIGSVPGFD